MQASHTIRKSFVSLCMMLALVLSAGSALAAKAGGGGYNGPGAAGGQYTQGGYTGPGPALVTVEQAKTMPDDAWVTLKGNIVQSLGDKRYLFRDATGEVQVKIGRKAWRGQDIGAGDVVEIRGEVDKDWMDKHIDVKQVLKTQ